MRVQAPGRTVFFLTEFQIDGMLEALRLELVDRVRSFRSTEGSVSGDSLGNYRLSLSVECQECSKNSTLLTQLLLSSLTYVSLSYFVRLHCANVHTPLCFFYP